MVASRKNLNNKTRIILLYFLIIVPALIIRECPCGVVSVSARESQLSAWVLLSLGYRIGWIGNLAASTHEPRNPRKLAKKVTQGAGCPVALTSPPPQYGPAARLIVVLLG